MKSIRTSRLLSGWLILCLICFLLSFCVAVPILCRPFYYAHILPLELPQKTGLSYQEIQQVYQEMMDFSLGLRSDFSLGVLPWSSEGAAHFVDVRLLFQLDLWMVLFTSSAILLSLWLSHRRGIRPAPLFGRGPGFWAALGLISLLLVLGLFAFFYFEQAFTLFHTLFFPGKTNWIFDWRTDPVILLLPQVFFQNCALLIGGLLSIFCLLLMGADEYLRRNRPLSPSRRGPSSPTSPAPPGL